ncbi:MAG: LacI family transcriptional regulator, partial [Anaerolineae bacterium]|nr:LacI family transcriptional regulator [Anaerolineae bacterium]
NANHKAKDLNLEDIAKEAGVSRATVSRVINNEAYVSEETRHRVQTVIEKLGYTPNIRGRILATGRTNIIGVVIPHSLTTVFDDQFYFPTLLNGVAQAANQRNYAMLLWIQESSTDEERFYDRILKNHLMDGVLLASAEKDNSFIPRLLDTGIPLAMVEYPDRWEDRINFVTVDNYEAAIVATKHLYHQGRRKIGHITGSLNNSDGLKRFHGYQQALAELGIPYREEFVFEGNFESNSGYRGMQALLKAHVDAVFCANDPTAIGALKALNELGVRVPGDIAVVGFDDLPTSERNKLTTIHQPIHTKGAQATHLLLDQIEGVSDGASHALLQTRLVIRETCGATITQRF